MRHIFEALEWRAVRGALLEMVRRNWTIGGYLADGFAVDRHVGEADIIAHIATDAARKALHLNVSLVVKSWNEEMLRHSDASCGKSSGVACVDFRRHGVRWQFRKRPSGCGMRCYRSVRERRPTKDAACRSKLRAACCTVQDQRQRMRGELFWGRGGGLAS